MTTVALVQMRPLEVPDVLTALVLLATVLAMVVRGLGPLPLMAAGAVVGALASVLLPAR